MKAVIIMATPCPKSLHDKEEKWTRATFSRVCFKKTASREFE